MLIRSALASRPCKTSRAQGSGAGVLCCSSPLRVPAGSGLLANDESARAGNFPFSRGLAFPRIVLNSIGESVLCPGNSFSLCKHSQKVMNPERMLQSSDVAQAEGTAPWRPGSRNRGCATGRAGKWMQVASESPALGGGEGHS